MHFLLYLSNLRSKLSHTPLRCPHFVHIVQRGLLQLGAMWYLHNNLIGLANTSNFLFLMSILSHWMSMLHKNSSFVFQKYSLEIKETRENVFDVTFECSTWWTVHRRLNLMSLWSLCALFSNWSLGLKICGFLAKCCSKACLPTSCK